VKILSCDASTVQNTVTAKSYESYPNAMLLDVTTVKTKL